MCRRKRKLLDPFGGIIWVVGWLVGGGGRVWRERKKEREP